MTGGGGDRKQQRQVVNHNANVQQAVQTQKHELLEGDRAIIN